MPLISNKIYQKYKLKSEKIILACSGGSDSLALFHYLYKNVENPQQSLIVCHFNHQIHSEADLHESFVADLCQKNSVKFYSKKEKIKNIAKKNKANLESTARDKRYEFFEQIRQKEQAKYVLTAQHQDDQVETILINYSRGAGLVGLAGMPLLHKQKHILRPLLTTPKKDIEKYLISNGLKFCKDPTNTDKNYVRNKIRILDLPKINKEIKDYNIQIIEFSNLCSKLNLEISLLVQKHAPSITLDHDKEELLINKKEFLNLPNHFQKLFLYQMFKFLQLNSSQKQIEKVLHASAQNKSGTKTKIADLTVYVDPLNIAIARNKSPKPLAEIKINLEKTSLPKTFTWNKQKIKISLLKDSKTRSIEKLLDFSDKEITIRQLKQGDKIASSRTKLKTILSKKKVPQRHRQLLPIIVNKENKILGIPGLTKSPKPEFTGENDCHFRLVLVDSKHRN